MHIHAYKDSKVVFQSLKEFGLKSTLKHALGCLGIGVYSTVKYPIIGFEAVVRANTFWKELERGRWELNCIRYLSNIIRKGQTLLDVGAWIGPYTILFSKLTQATGRVYAFDPDPKAFNILQENVEKNSLTNVSIERICVSNSVGKAAIGTCSLGNSKTHLVKHRKRARLTEIIAETTTIDEFCEENAICPDGIKIDVEGAELEVLKGATGLLSSSSRPVVMCELADIRTEPWDYRSCEIYEFLETYDYRWFSVTPEGRLRPCPRKEQYHESLIAVPEEILSAVAAFVERSGQECTELM